MKAEQEDENKLAPTEFSVACAELERLFNECIRVLSEAAHKVESQSGQMLKAKWKADPRPRDDVEALMKILNAARVHDAEAKCEAWVESLRKRDAETTWTTVRTLYLQFIKPRSPQELRPSQKAKSNLKPSSLLFSLKAP